MISSREGWKSVASKKLVEECNESGECFCSSSEGSQPRLDSAERRKRNCLKALNKFHLILEDNSNWWWCVNIFRYHVNRNDLSIAASFQTTRRSNLRRKLFRNNSITRHILRASSDTATGKKERSSMRAEMTSCCCKFDEREIVKCLHEMAKFHALSVSKTLLSADNTTKIDKIIINFAFLVFPSLLGS